MTYEHTPSSFLLLQNHIYTSTTIILPFYASMEASSLLRRMCACGRTMSSAEEILRLGSRGAVVCFGGTGGLGCVALIDVTYMSSMWEPFWGPLDVWRGFPTLHACLLGGIVGLLVSAPRSWMAIAL